jgi:hypothetical protein
MPSAQKRRSRGPGFQDEAWAKIEQTEKGIVAVIEGAVRSAAADGIVLVVDETAIASLARVQLRIHCRNGGQGFFEFPHKGLQPCRARLKGPDARARVQECE